MGPECVNQILYLEYSHVDCIFWKQADSQLMQSILKNAYRAYKAVDSPAWDFHLYPPTTKIMFLMSYVPMVNPRIIAIKLLNKTVSLFYSMSKCYTENKNYALSIVYRIYACRIESCRSYLCVRKHKNSSHSIVSLHFYWFLFFFFSLLLFLRRHARQFLHLFQHPYPHASRKTVKCISIYPN